MGMRAECLAAVSNAAGRKLTQQEGDRIIQDIRNEMNRLSRADPEGWNRLSFSEQVREAGKGVASIMQRRAEQKKANLRKQAIINDENDRRYEQIGKEQNKHAFAAVAQMLLEFEKRAKGVQNELMSQLLDTVNGIGTRWLGFVEDANDVRDFVREVYGEKTGNERAAKAAETWAKTADTGRERLIRAGADVGRIDYGYIPQSHDGWRMRKAGKEKWIDDTLPLIDRTRFTNDEGRQMSGGELREVLSAVFDDIVTNGNNYSTLFGMAQSIRMPPAAKLNRGDGRRIWDRRSLHFKDADSFLAYESAYGEGGLTQTLTAHVQRVARDIALMESLGPRADAAYQRLHLIAEADAMNARKTESKIGLLMKYSDYQGFTGAHIDDMWNNLTGVASLVAPNHEGVAQFMAGWRNLEIVGKLGKAFISSLSDIPSYFMTSGFNRLDFTEGLMFLFRTWGMGSGGKEWRDYANRAGFIADSIASNFNRWAADNLGQGWTSKMANATMRASLLSGFTDTVRQAFCLNMSAGLAKMAKKSWAELDSYDRARLTQGGITEHDWKMLQAAGAERFHDTDFLTIRQLQALNLDRLGPEFTQADIDALPSKYLGFIIGESEMASLGPDLVTRAETNRGLQRGTAGGELVRSIALFKSFPLAMMEKHFRRAAFLWHNGSHVDQLAYGASLIVGTTVFGAISVQVQNLLNGKDPENVWTTNFWLEAMSKAGGLGYLSDLITYGLSEESRYGSMSGLANIAGPVVSSAIDAADLAKAAIGEGLYDKDTKVGSKAVRLARSHMPFVNMWYTSTAIDRAVMNELNEYLSPGYMKKTRRRLRRGTGQDYWWPLGETEPARAPEMATPPRK